MIIHLTTDLFWTDIYNIERWPEVLTKLPHHIESQSKVDVAKDYLNYKTDEKGRIIKADEVYGLFGLERKNNKNIIAGCNFIIREGRGYLLSEETINLIKAYEANNDWELLLAQQLLKYSVRVRTLFIALLNSDGVFFKDGFLKNTKDAYINLKETKYFVLNPDNKHNNLNTLMLAFPKESLGYAWIDILGIDENEEITIKGLSKEEPSLKQVGSYFKMPLILFNHLGWFREKTEDIFVLDKTKIMNEIDRQLYNSLILNDTVDEIEILKSIIHEHEDSRGYFPVSIVGEILKNKLDPFSTMKVDTWIDKYFVSGQTNGDFKVVGNEQGQPRHGRGLLGDKEQQLIKLVF